MAQSDSWSLRHPNTGGTHHSEDLAQELRLGLQAPLDLLRHGFRQPQRGDGLFQSLQGALGARLLPLALLALPLEATRLSLVGWLRSGTLLALVVGSGTGHGRLRHLVASPRFCPGGDHALFYVDARIFISHGALGRIRGHPKHEMKKSDHCSLNCLKGGQPPLLCLHSRADDPFTVSDREP